MRFTRPEVTEEYSVSVDGVRQDFVIAERPVGTGDLRVELALTEARAEAAAYGAKLILEGSGRALAYSRLRATDAAGQELRARLEVYQSSSESRKQKAERSQSLLTSTLRSVATEDGPAPAMSEAPAPALVVVVEDAEAMYPVRIDPTFSDANWVSLNPGMPGANGTVDVIAVDGSGNVYVGGSFSFIGTVPANHIAKWNGSAWSALGAGIGGIGDGYGPGVNCLACDTFGNVYVGGDFSTAGGVTANYIAKWNGSAWSALGAGGDGDVFALAVSGTTLYAGGNFTHAGGVTANGIAAWNGSAWSALGAGMGGVAYPGISALVVSGTNLYAGGNFATAGGVPANCIAKWDGSAWSALGTGIGGGSYPSVGALAVSGTTVYAGGYFTTAGGVAANSIAAWNGSAWSALGAGMGSGSFEGTGPSVSALAADGSGHLFVGGYFYLAGTSVSPFIAQANIGAGLSAGRLGSLVYSPATGFGCTFSDAVIGQPYHIQTSPSLAGGSWTNFTNFTYTGPMVNSDPSAALGPKKFYRAVSP